MRTREDKTGQVRTMNCGMNAKIIAYRSCSDIDVEFEDGTVAKNKEYNSFKKGAITKPKNRIGETKVMNCGEEAKIIAYRNSSDIDVQFENGVVVKKRAYDGFKKGTIANPNPTGKPTSKPTGKKALKYLGETRVMNCKMSAKIVAYRGCNDIDVQFEDGTIAKKKTYANFKVGGIANPNITKIPNKVDERIGEVKIMNCGMSAKIVAYRNAADIDVQFEDGTIAKKKMYAKFKVGRIAKPNIANPNITKIPNKVDERIGEVKIMNCGMSAKITAYRSAADIDVQFEDGAVTKHRTYNSFKKGAIAKPKNRIGETKVMNCGEEAKIIAYRNSSDIDVEFENGTVTKHRTYSSFKTGRIANLNIPKIAPVPNKANEYIGKVRTMNCKMNAKIIAYRNYNDIDVEFEDGAIARNKTYDSFKNGKIAKPKLANPKR